ncbi:hypothetical protein, partial [Phocoenobacter atlanticus]
ERYVEHCELGINPPLVDDTVYEKIDIIEKEPPKEEPQLERYVEHCELGINPPLVDDTVYEKIDIIEKEPPKEEPQLERYVEHCELGINPPLVDDTVYEKIDITEKEPLKEEPRLVDDGESCEDIEEYLVDDNVYMEGNEHQLYIYKNSEHSNMDHFTGIQNIYLSGKELKLTISDDVLDKIANDDNDHKVIINSEKLADELYLEGNFIKTTETESHNGQEYIKYTDEIGNALIVDPDITVI